MTNFYCKGTGNELMVHGLCYDSVKIQIIELFF